MKRTACAKHHETNITSCPPELKEPAMELLYGRNISIHMAYETRDTLLSLLSRASISSKTRDWFNKTFGSDEGMMVSVHSLTDFEWTKAPQMNTQAFRNFMMTAGFCADSMIELFFRNVKGVKASRWCTPFLTVTRLYLHACSVLN